MACSGDPSQICGGGNRLTVFKYQPASVNVSTACVETYTKTDLIEARSKDGSLNVSLSVEKVDEGVYILAVHLSH